MLDWFQSLGPSSQVWLLQAALFFGSLCAAYTLFSLGVAGAPTAKKLAGRGFNKAKRMRNAFAAALSEGDASGKVNAAMPDVDVTVRPTRSVTYMYPYTKVEESLPTCGVTYTGPVQVGVSETRVQELIDKMTTRHERRIGELAEAIAAQTRRADAFAEGVGNARIRDVEHRSATMQALLGRLTALEADCNAFSGRLSDVDVDISAINADITNLQGRCESLDNGLDNVCRSLGEQDGDVAYYTSINDEPASDGDVADLYAQVDIVNRNIDSLNLAMSTVRNDIESVRDVLFPESVTVPEVEPEPPVEERQAQYHNRPRVWARV